MILQKIKLVTPEYIKSQSTVSENMDEKYVNPAIYTAQTQDLQALIGTKLSSKLCELVDEQTIDDPENAAYKELYEDYVQPYLVPCVQAEIVIANIMKTRNAGQVQYYDTNITNSSIKDIQYLAQHYRDQAAFLGNRLTEWLKCNLKNFPEYRAYCACKCDGMSPNPKSSINIGLVL